MDISKKLSILADATKYDASCSPAVVSLGVTAARSLVDSRFKLEHNRGQFMNVNNLNILPTYHPAAVLRNNQSEEIYNLLVTDLIAAKQFLTS